MNDYGFDYMNYITNIPNNMKYNQLSKTNMNYTIDNQNITNTLPKQQPLDPTQGWLRGNLFSNLYEPYKNYKPANLDPKTERETLLFQVMQYKFALIELNLYLDTHPSDTETINLYNKYLNIEKQMCDKYESMYGPLTLDSNYLNKNTWTWQNSPWPWEVI
jgi:spore coat protein JB